MKMKLLAFSILAVLSMASAQANATTTTVNLGVQTPKTDQNLSFVSAAYSDYSETYIFTLNKSYNLKTTAVENSNKKTDLINNKVTLFELEKSTNIYTYVDSYLFNNKSTTDVFNNLTTGSYQIVLTGTNRSKFDTTVNLLTSLSKVTTIASVPEPETYVMLLAGLGLMGVMVRRRKMAW